MPIRDDSAGGYGTWSSDDLSLIDWLKANASDGGNALANLGRNLVDGFSPIGTSEQGNMALQVPPMAQGLADSAVRLFGTPNAPGNMYGLTGVPEFDKPIQDDMTNLQLALYGGNAVSGLTKPRGALGAGAMKEAARLPMDHASRMARAREMGFDVDRTWYHGTGKEFDEFDLGAAGSGGNAGNIERAVFLTDNPAVADTYLGKQYINAASPYADGLIGSVDDGVKTVYNEGARVMPLMSRRSDDFEVWDMGGGAYSPSFMQRALSEAREANAPGVVFENMRDPGLMSLGRPKASNVMAVFDPSNIRSINAAFDPARAGENGLLLSDTGKPSILGSAMAGSSADLSSPAASATTQPLAMDHASRMARAKELGFDVDTTWYHGTSGHFPEFKPSTDGVIGPGVYLSSDNGVAAEYGPIVGEYRVRGPLIDEYDVGKLAGELYKNGSRDSFSDALAEMKKRGYTGVIHGQNVAVWNPVDLRSVDAAFDPARAAEGGLLLSDNRPSLLGSALATGGENYDLPEWLRF